MRGQVKGRLSSLKYPTITNREGASRGTLSADCLVTAASDTAGCGEYRDSPSIWAERLESGRDSSSVSGGGGVLGAGGAPGEAGS